MLSSGVQGINVRVLARIQAEHLGQHLDAVHCKRSTYATIAAKSTTSG